MTRLHFTTTSTIHRGDFHIITYKDEQQPVVVESVQPVKTPLGWFNKCTGIIVHVKHWSER